MVFNQATLESLTRAFTTIFNKSLEETQTFWQRIAMEVPSSTSEMVYAWMKSIPGMREWLGDRVINRLGETGYSIVNKSYELTLGVERTRIEDDQYGVYNALIAEMARSVKTHPDTLIFGLLAAGFSEICSDGQYFFDTDHPVGAGTVSNMQAGSGSAWYLMDTTRAIKPLVNQVRKRPEFVAKNKLDDDNVFMRSEFLYGTDSRGNAGFGLWQLAFASKADLTAANFKTLRTSMSSQKNDHGQPLAIKPNLLLVPPTLEDAAKEIILPEQINGTTNTLRNSVEILVVPYLS